MIEILNRWNNAVVYRSEDAQTIAEAVALAVSSRANLARANLARVNLARVNLAGAYLAHAYLAGAYLEGANLAHANLARVNLEGANLARANLAGAYLEGANLAGARGLNPLLVDHLRILRDQDTIVAYRLVDAEMRSPMRTDGASRINYAIGEEYTEPDASTDESQQCAAGLHVATLAWCLREWKPGWRILRVQHAGADIAAIPLGTDGKWRVRRLRVLAEVPMSEWGEGPWSAKSNGGAA